MSDLIKMKIARFYVLLGGDIRVLRNVWLINVICLGVKEGVEFIHVSMGESLYNNLYTNMSRNDTFKRRQYPLTCEQHL
jgi:hypothetical protein